MTYDVGNPNPDWGQAHICGVVKLVNGYQPTFFLLDLQGQYRYKQTIENHVRIRIQ